jgi:hypothetical protein
MSITLSRIGAINGVAGTYDQANALFLRVFSGEVLTAFRRACVFRDLTLEKTITSGRSAQFPILGRALSRYHTPGQMVGGQGSIAQNEVVINVDDLVIADATIYDLDEAKNHFDSRQIYSVELGEALARQWDRRVARVACMAARQSVSDLAANLPAGLTPDQQPRTGTRINLANASPTGNQLVSAVFAAAQAMDEKDVPPGDRFLICRPAEYYSLIQSDRAVNQDWNAGNGGAPGSYREAQLTKLAGFTVLKSNHIAQGNVTAPAGEQGFVWNGATIQLSSVDMTQTRMLAIQRNAVGVVKLRGMSMQMTGNDYNAMYQSTLMVGKYVAGFGYVRPEGTVEVWNSL